MKGGRGRRFGRGMTRIRTFAISSLTSARAFAIIFAKIRSIHDIHAVKSIVYVMLRVP